MSDLPPDASGDGANRQRQPRYRRPRPATDPTDGATAGSVDGSSGRPDPNRSRNPNRTGGGRRDPRRTNESQPAELMPEPVRRTLVPPEVTAPESGHGRRGGLLARTWHRLRTQPRPSEKPLSTVADSGGPVRDGGSGARRERGRDRSRDGHRDGCGAPDSAADESESAREPMRHESILLAGGLLLFLLFLYRLGPMAGPLVVEAAIVGVLWPVRRGRVAKAILWTTGLLFAFWFLVTVSSLLVPFFIAVLLAYMLDPLVERLSRWLPGLPRVVFSIALTLTAVGLIVTGLVFLIPSIVGQVETLIVNIQGLPAQAIAYIKRPETQQLMARAGIDPAQAQERVQAEVTAYVSKAGPYVAGLLKQIVQSVGALINIVTNIILVPFLTIYLLKDWQKMRENFFLLFSKNRRGKAIHAYRDVDHLLGKWLRGQVTLSFANAVLLSIGFEILHLTFGLRYPLLLGILGGVLNFIPYFGLLVTLVVSLGVALLSDDPMSNALGVLAVIFVVQMLESSVLGPKIVGESVGLHPVVLILALLIFGFFFGVPGMFVAVPVTALGLLLLRNWMAQRRQEGMEGLF